MLCCKDGTFNAGTDAISGCVIHADVAAGHASDNDGKSSIGGCGENRSNDNWDMAHSTEILKLTFPAPAAPAPAPAPPAPAPLVPPTQPTVAQLAATAAATAATQLATTAAVATATSTPIQHPPHH